MKQKQTDHHYHPFMKFQGYCITALTCCPLQANFSLSDGPVNILQSVKTIFLPIFDTSVSISTSQPIRMTLRNQVLSEMEIVRSGVILSIPIVVITSIIVARAPPCTVSWIFLCPPRNLYLKDASLGLSGCLSRAMQVAPKSCPNPPMRLGLPLQSCSTYLALKSLFMIYCMSQEIQWEYHQKRLLMRLRPLIEHNPNPWGWVSFIFQRILLLLVAIFYLWKDVLSLRQKEIGIILLLVLHGILLLLYSEFDIEARPLYLGCNLLNELSLILFLWFIMLLIKC